MVRKEDDLGVLRHLGQHSTAGASATIVEVHKQVVGDQRKEALTARVAVRSSQDEAPSRAGRVSSLISYLVDRNLQSLPRTSCRLQSLQASDFRLAGSEAFRGFFPTGSANEPAAP